MSDECYHAIRILKFGDSKSGLLAKIGDDPESNAYSLKDSAGLDSIIKTLELHGKTLKLQIFEFSELGQFKIFRSNYQFKPDGIIIVYDVTEIESFNKAKKWLERNDIYASVCKLLIGDTCGLDDNEEKKVVKTITAKGLASKFETHFIETSAEDPTILEQTLEAMACNHIETSKINKTGAVQMEG